MPKIERSDIKNNRTIPIGLKLALLISVIFGLWMRSNCRQNEIDNIIIERIILENQTRVSAEIVFDMVNNTRQSGRKNIIIEIYTSQNELIADRLTTVDISPMQTRRYVRTVENFKRTVADEEVLFAEVKLYHRSAFR